MPFHVVASDTTAAADALLPSSRDAHERQLLQRVWLITSTQQLQTLHVKVPGRVFIDYDSSLSASCADATASCTATMDAPLSDTSATTAPTSTETTTVVAKIVVTSSSRRVLDDLLEVVPLYGAKEDKGVRFHVANQSATLLQCAVLTQIYVSAASEIRELLSNGADVVIGERVLVQHDTDASLDIKSLNRGDLFLHTTSGFSLQKLEVRKTGSGDIQIQTPSLEASGMLSLSSGGGDRSTMRVAVDTMRAKMIIALAARSHAVAVQTNVLATEMFMVWAVAGGHVAFSGHDGSATHHVSIVSGGGCIDTAAVLADVVSASVLGSGVVIAQASKTLQATATGSGRIQYAGKRPDNVTERTTRSWFRWQRTRNDVVTPHDAALDSTDDKVTSALRANPPREPKTVDVRVSKSLFGSEPKLEVDGELAATSRWTWTLVGGAAAVVAVVVVAAKRKH